MKALQGFKKVLFQAILILYCLTLCLFISCNKDDEPQPNNDLIGKWTIVKSSIELSLENKSLIQYLVDETGISQQEAEAIVNPIMDDLNVFFLGLIEFKKDHTYVLNLTMNGGSDSGTWSLSDDNKTLLLDEDTTDETEATILKLSPLTLNIEMVQNAEEDIDEDGNTEHMNMKVNLELVKDL